VFIRFLDPDLIAKHTHALFVWLISHQSAVLFSQNKPTTSNQPAVLFSQNKSTPTINNQPNEQAEANSLLAVRILFVTGNHAKKLCFP
jgi:hypothetical protein